MKPFLTSPIPSKYLAHQSDDIFKAAVGILDTVELQQSVRLLGIRLTNLRHQDQASQLKLDN